GGERGVELLLLELFRRRVTEGIGADAAHPLAPVVEQRGEGALAGAIADEALGVAELDVVGIDAHRRQLAGAVTREDGRRLARLGFGHSRPSRTWGVQPQRGAHGRVAAPPVAPCEGGW